MRARPGRHPQHGHLTCADTDESGTLCEQNEPQTPGYACITGHCIHAASSTDTETSESTGTCKQGPANRVAICLPYQPKLTPQASVDPDGRFNFRALDRISSALDTFRYVQPIQDNPGWIVKGQTVRATRASPCDLASQTSPWPQLSTPCEQARAGRQARPPLSASCGQARSIRQADGIQSSLDRTVEAFRSFRYVQPDSSSQLTGQARSGLKPSVNFRTDRASPIRTPVEGQHPRTVRCIGSTWVQSKGVHSRRSVSPRYSDSVRESRYTPPAWRLKLQAPPEQARSTPGHLTALRRPSKARPTLHSSDLATCTVRASPSDTRQ